MRERRSSLAPSASWRPQWVFSPSSDLSVSIYLVSFLFILSVAKSGPDSMTPEGKEARLKYMREQNANPIRGISSKKEEEEA